MSFSDISVRSVMLVIMYGLFALMALDSYRTHYFGSWQIRPKTLKKEGFFVEHSGMWLDVVMVSWLVPVLMDKCWRNWSGFEITVAVMVSIFITAFMLHKWRLDGKDMEEAFVQKGQLTTAGWIHGLYMIIAISVVILYYCATPPAEANQCVDLVTIALALHITVSLAVPQLHSHGKVPAEVIGYIGIGIFVLTIAWALIKYYAVWKVQ